MKNSVPSSLENVVETDEGPTFTRKIGKGPLIIVVHGGPGFDHNYLVPALQQLADRRTLLFYDMPGCGGTPSPSELLTLAHCYRHLRSFVAASSQGDPLGVIAHSWGGLVLAGALALTDGGAPALPRIDEGLLINPTPVSSAPYEAARARLVAKMPLSVKLRAPLRALLTGNCSEVMRILLPYYMYDAANIPDGPFPLNLKTYRTLDAQLKDFDYSASLPALRAMKVLRGSDEFASPEDIADLIEATSGLLTIDQAGHFPFWDSPGPFAAAVDRIFQK